MQFPARLSTRKSCKLLSPSMSWIALECKSSTSSLRRRSRFDICVKDELVDLIVTHTTQIPILTLFSTYFGADRSRILTIKVISPDTSGMVSMIYDVILEVSLDCIIHDLP